MFRYNPKGCRTTKLGPMDAPFRGRNPLRRVLDAGWLQAEIERQAKERYIAGKYTLGKLNWNGQRISIRVIIPRRDGTGEVSFITGWMVEPGGKLRMTTPYGGK